MTRSKGNWKEIIEGKTAYQIARFITGDLLGYRSTSLSRSDDEDSLTNLIEAIMEGNRDDR